MYVCMRACLCYVCFRLLTLSSAPGATESDGVKERFRMKAKYVLGYLKGENTVIKKLNKAIKQNRVPAEEGLKLVQIATEIQDEIVSKSLRPGKKSERLLLSLWHYLSMSDGRQMN